MTGSHVSHCLTLLTIMMTLCCGPGTSILAAVDESVILVPNDVGTEISSRTYVFADASGKLTINDVARQDFQGFQRNRSDGFSKGVFAGNLWVRFSVSSSEEHARLYYLHLEKPLLDVQFYQDTEKGMSEQQGGRLYAIGEETLSSTFPVFRLELPQVSAKKTYYVKIRNDGVHSLSLVIRDGEGVWARDRLDSWFAGSVSGIIFIMILYNLFLYFSTREKDFLWYSLAVFFLHYGVIAGGVTNSLVYSYKLMIFPEIWIPFCKIIGTIALIEFSRIFLRTKAQSKRVDRILIGVNIYSLLMLASFTFLSPPLVNAIDNLGAAVGLITVISYSGILFARGNKYARFYFIAWFPMLLVAFLHVIIAMTGRGHLMHYTPTLLVLASLLEVLLLSLALADKINVLREEKMQEEAAARAQKEELDRQHNEEILRINASLEIKVQQQTADIRALLDNLPMAVVSVDRDGCLGENISAYTRKIFGERLKQGDNIQKAIFKHSDQGADQQAAMMAAIASSIGPDDLGYTGNEGYLIQRFVLTSNQGERIFEASWAPIYSEREEVNHLLLCIKDITENEKLKLAAVKAEELGQAMQEILLAGPQKVSDILGSLRPNFNEFLQSMATNSQNMATLKHAAETFFRCLHTQKAMARVLRLTRLADSIHSYEDKLSEIRGQATSLSDTQSWSDEAQQFETTLHFYEDLLAKIVEAFGAKSGIRDDSQSLANVITHIIEAIPEMARSAQKPIPALRLEAPIGLQLNKTTVQKMQGMLLHLIRNAIDHGIEFPDQRQKLGKPEQGLISLQLLQQPGSHTLRLVLKDDGAGLDKAMVFQKASDRGLVVGTAIPAEEVIFLSGFTSKDKVSDLSGRGVGLDAVRADAQLLGGDAKASLGDRNGNGNHELQFEVSLKTAS